MSTADKETPDRAGSGVEGAQQDGLPAEHTAPLDGRTVSVERLTEDINQAHDRWKKRQTQALYDARLCGELLSKVRERIAHGDWQRYVRENLAFKARQAQKYMRLHRRWDQLAVSITDDASINGAMAELAEPANAHPSALLDGDPPGIQQGSNKDSFDDSPMGVQEADEATEAAPTADAGPVTLEAEFARVDERDDQRNVQRNDVRDVERDEDRNVDMRKPIQRFAKALEGVDPKAHAKVVAEITTILFRNDAQHHLRLVRDWCATSLKEITRIESGLDIDLEESEIEVLRDRNAELARDAEEREAELEARRKAQESDDGVNELVKENAKLTEQLRLAKVRGDSLQHDKNNLIERVESLQKQLFVVEGKLAAAKGGAQVRGAQS